MTFSSLISGTVPHHNKYSKRTGSVMGIVQHHWASNNSSGEAALVSPTTKKSANYLIYSDGTIKGQVPEEYRAWTSGSLDADGRRITIECQNSTLAPAWQVSQAAFNSIIRLIADIARRYHWASLTDVNYRGHRTFASTACPGPYLWVNMQVIRDAATAQLLGGKPNPPTTPGDDDMDAQERQWLIEVHEAVGRFERTWGTGPRPDGSKRDYIFDVDHDRITETLVLVQGLASEQGLELDEAALAAALLPQLVVALEGKIGTLTDETLAAISEQVADELHRRSES